MSSTHHVHTATDSDEYRVAYDEMHPMDALHLQQFNFIPLSQSQLSHPYPVFGEAGGENLTGGSFSFPANDNTLTEQPIDLFDQHNIPSVPSQLSTMLLDGDLSSSGPHGGSIDSQNVLQLIGPISWPNFGTEAFASGPEWPSAPMETTYMPQNPWTGVLPQWMPEELSRMTINEPSLQLPHTLEPPDIIDLDYQNPMQAHSSGTTYPFFTVGDGVEFEGVENIPLIPGRRDTGQIA